MPRLRVHTEAQPHEYEIRIGRGILLQVGGVARSCLGKRAGRIAVISNPKVFAQMVNALSPYREDMIRKRAPQAVQPAP